MARIDAAVDQLHRTVVGIAVLALVLVVGHPRERLARRRRPGVERGVRHGRLAAHQALLAAVVGL
ncbi:MAG TPA: hypothetical protein VN253_15480, partial [Kofleriaceae bacterium]|nr:hypothetical protein [Kofleriaceae bacterium]